MTLDLEEIVLGAIMSVFIPLVLFSLVGTVKSLRLQQECQRLGYSTSTLTIAFTSYCGARIEQTDYVVPIDSARAHPRMALP